MDQPTRKKKHRDLARRFQARLAKTLERRRSEAALDVPPRYDEVFEKGVAWLDRLAHTDRWEEQP